MKHYTGNHRLPRQTTGSPGFAKFILGAQYFRVMPPPEEWDADMARMKAIGMNAVKIEAVWSQVEPAMGRYEWQELDGLMDCACKHGLGVMLTLTFETVPDAIVRRFQPRVTGLNRQPVPIARLIGGVGRDCVCWDHPGVARRVALFLRATVRRYRRHPALLCWDVFQEVDIPECACAHTARLYRAWLKAKFADIGALNRTFGERYRSFAMIEPPHLKSYEGQSFLNYRRFLADCLAARIRRLYRMTKAIDPRHPVIAHSHSGGPGIHNNWLAAREVDFYATSFHEVLYQATHASPHLLSGPIFNLESMRAVARDINYFWMAELTCGAAFATSHVHRRLNEGELTFDLWASTAHGARGMFLWQFKPERIFMHETPHAWGLFQMNGDETYRSREFKAFQDVIHRHEQLFMNMRTPPAPYGLLYSPDSATVSRCLGYKNLDYTSNLYGATYLFWINNLLFDILRFAEDIRDYRAIYAPMPWLLDDKIMTAIEAYVRRGGTFIADGGLARYTQEGLASAEVPGNGLARKLGAREIDFAVEEKIVVKTARGIIQGAQERGWLQAGSNKVLGAYANGQPAIVRCKLGRGAFILNGTSLAAPFYRPDPVAGLAPLRRWRELFDFQPDVTITPPGQIVARLQVSGGRRPAGVLFVFNIEQREARARVTLAQPFTRFEMLWGPSAQRTGARALRVCLEPKGVAVIKLSY